ncbi:hypothetical protein LSUCC0387_07865 [Rhodobacterales bacterium LSUCC0387]|nr:hypothetical protein [Rhodobacterales bacterium LSUCC0374]MBF9040806.1 hypothetical protein [Rhodobacterales bacterium LSUCC0387]
MNVKLKQRTFNFALSVPLDAADKVETAISDHATWMRETHSYDDSKIQLVHYYVSKANELVNIADPSQGTTNRVLYSINEVYVMDEGIDQHLAAGQSWKNFQSFVGTITEFGSVLIANGEVIETL